LCLKAERQGRQRGETLGRAVDYGGARGGADEAVLHFRKTMELKEAPAKLW